MQVSTVRQYPDPANCTCWGANCIEPMYRKYLAQGILKIKNQDDGKPVYRCYLESDAEWELLEPNTHEELFKDTKITKLEREV
ncbi:hypothetical protein Y032_0210g2120 [Ancylostoma ceylanicum]|uniref:Uncharacterized protein n=1 Tax=Ancylostoma ceylanicum TaxID=53326 RepID=A0A016SLB5_9BILA|nr:hypothetical protein Y032_0210g2120 [Ancylostoma ceylanicum]